MQGGTYGGNAVACAAASATIDVINDEDLCGNSTRRGQQLMKGEIHTDNTCAGLLMCFNALAPEGGHGHARAATVAHARCH